MWRCETYLAYFSLKNCGHDFLFFFSFAIEAGCRSGVVRLPGACIGHFPDVEHPPPAPHPRHHHHHHHYHRHHHHHHDHHHHHIQHPQHVHNALMNFSHTIRDFSFYRKPVFETSSLTIITTTMIMLIRIGC